MTTRESSQSIEEAAADWVARRDRAVLSSEDEAAFARWMQGDNRRPGAFLRAQAVFRRSEAAVALGASFDPAAFREAVAPAPVPVPAVTRRNALIWGGGLAATLVVGGVGFGLNVPTAYATSRGEIRLVRLDDGSTIFLNTDTKVEVKYRTHDRIITLVRGEAFFSARKDLARPFLVKAGDQAIRTEGAAFRVRMLDDTGADILVSDGKVQTIRQEGSAADVLLRHGMRIALPTEKGQVVKPVAVSSDEIMRDLAWREGNIAFHGESLRQAAGAFARYGDPRIEIADEGLAKEAVTGLFAANDPVGFSRAVGDVFGATVSVKGDVVLISRPSAKKDSSALAEPAQPHL